jgi:hypothetical protein
MKYIVNFFVMLLGGQKRKKIVIEGPKIVRHIRHRSIKPRIYNYR